MKENSKLTILGGKNKGFPASPARAVIETFPNRYPGKDYWVLFDCPEFSSLCPKTGQPDFGTLKIRYMPGAGCIETKSLKLYLYSFRNVGMFNEEAVNRILEDLVKACKPKKMEIEAVFNPRGGISITVEVKHP